MPELPQPTRILKQGITGNNRECTNKPKGRILLLFINDSLNWAELGWLQTMDELLICPLCKVGLSAPTKPSSITRVLCPNCGAYDLAQEFYEDFLKNAGSILTKKNLATLSYAIRGRQPSPPLLVEEWANQTLKNTALPTASEQLDNLILYLGNQLSGPGETVNIDPFELTAELGSTSESATSWNIQGAFKENLIEGVESLRSFLDVTLTYAGWKRFADIQNEVANSKKAFMAMKFGDPEMDRVFHECLKPAAARAGYTLFKLNDDPRAGLIDDRLRLEIRTSRFVIADLSHENKGTYWEAGYAEGLGRPVIYTCKESVFLNPTTRPHFDTNHYLCIQWNADHLRDSEDQLTAVIRATLPNESKLED